MFVIIKHLNNSSKNLKWMNLTHFGSCLEKIHDDSASQLELKSLSCDVFLRGKCPGSRSWW